AYRKPYPGLGEKQSIILDLLKNESEAFLRTLDKGEAKIKAFLDNPGDPAWIAPLPPTFALPDKPPRKLAKLVEAGELELPELPKLKHAKPPKGVLNGEIVFDLEQTYGFPGDVTRFILREHEREIDPIGYVHAEVRHIMVSKGEGGEIKQAFDTRLDEAKHRIGKTEFIGYTDDHIVLGGEDYVVIDEHGKPVEELKKGQTAELYARTTPFYAEQGGQLGDHGTLSVAGKNGKGAPTVVITDCQLAGDMRTHFIKVEDGTLDLRKRPKLELRIDTSRRDSIRRHHTATHLLHHALRQVLGDHVHQKGSLVAPDRLRFDFTHTESMTPDQLDEIERIANRSVFEDAEVSTDISTPDEAKKRGAMALFGEKYGDVVRVVICGPTIELCGGTHVRRAGEIGGVRIVSQASSAAGVRRIEALCGDALLQQQQTERRLLSGIAEKLKTPADRIPDAIERLQKQLKEARDEAKKAASAASSSAEPDFASSHVKAFWLPEDTSRDALKNFADQAADSFGDAKGVVFCVAGKSLVAKGNQKYVDGGGHIGDLVKKHGASHGIRGGGSPVFIQGKAPDTKDALLAFAKAVADLV
ncbi:MAG: alanine--tRNA ligase-related protein, partial [Planctomycetota bacterium]